MLAAALRIALGGATSIVLAGMPGCLGDEIKANQAQLAQQQAQLDQLKQQVAALQAQSSLSRGAAVAPGGCDETVMREASRKGGERFAASDFAHALAYYQDAVSACPANSRAQLNLARAYESLGQPAQARTHYQLAAAATSDSDGAAKEARDALARLRP